MITTDKEIKVKDLKSGVRPIWCPGCGDYGVFSALLNSIVELKLDPSHVAIASGIGCSGRFPAFVKAYGFHGVHGRSLPLATGMKVANPDLTVVAVGGDGDVFSIGAGHIPHAARRNVDITCLVMDNEVYGLTKGQPSPTTPLGVTFKASPYGTVDNPVNPILMMLSYRVTLVMQAFSAQKDLSELIGKAILHRGLSVVRIISPCVSYRNTYQDVREIVTPIPEDHDPTDLTAAIKLAMDDEEEGRISTGIFYQVERPAHDAELVKLREVAGDGDFSLEELVGRFRR
jgi:2-oxoglutarate ferredoxin oxidoreductase subunit beta